MTRHFCRAFVVALLAVAGLVSPVVYASMLPDPTGGVIVAQYNPGYTLNSAGVVAGSVTTLQFTGGDSSVTLPSTFAGSATAQIYGFPEPSVFVSAANGGYAVADANYAFQLNGPATTQLATVDLLGSIYLVQNPTNFSFGATDARIGVNGQTIAAATFLPQANTPIPINVLLSVPVNTPIPVELTARAVSVLGTDLTDEVLIDPSIQIDPSFLTGGEYSLAFSDGIGNSPISPTPLPASLPMFGVALIGLGALAWRRRSRA
jgi:hypothetical protein